MSSTKIIIKHNKHRIHPCPNEKKLSLLTLLLEQNNTQNIIVVSSLEVEQFKEIATSKNITFVNDEKLAEQPDLTCDLLISYDLPLTDVYMSRLSRAKESALILLDIGEQQNLYPIETILKRVIRQDVIVGYEYEPQEELKIAQKSLQKDRGVYKFDPDASVKPSYEKNQTEHKKSFDKPKYDKPKYDKVKKDGDTSQRKPFDKPKYDKPQFDKPKWDKPKKEGESSERKPFDKPKWDKPKYDDQKRYDKPKRDGEGLEKKEFDKPKWDKPKYDGEKKYDNSGKKPNKYLGKDDSGKAKFSGKSGERNHKYDGKPRENIEAPKNIGRKITIKERKPKDEPSS